MSDTHEALLTFPCGGTYTARSYAASARRRKRDGRVRLVVIDTETPLKPTQPSIAGTPARCLDGCPVMAHRTQFEAWWSPGHDAPGMRLIVECSAVLTRAVPLTTDVEC